MASGFWIVSGTMGGGKTYAVVEICAEAFGQGAIVHSNVDFDLEELERRGWKDQLLKLPEDPLHWEEMLVGGAEGAENLLVVDEAAVFFHQRNQMAAKKSMAALFDLLVQSRKLGLEVYFVSQSVDNLDRSLRLMATGILHCVQTKRIPIFGPLIKRFRGDFMRRRYAPGKNRSELVPPSYARFRPEIGALYKTDEFLGRGLNIQRQVTRQGQTKGEKLPTGLKVMLWLVGLSFAWWARHFFGGSEPEAVAPKSVVASQNASPPPAIVEVPNDESRRVAPGMREFTWDPSDERVFYSVHQTRTGHRIFCGGRDFFALGECVEGERITEIVPFRGRFYVTGEQGRTWCLRKETAAEIEARRLKALQPEPQMSVLGLAQPQDFLP
ncbi:MAG: hypothetical protein KDK99_16565 [Verrucomicrobiales bacterium]|nr:hypothetical protein [Verrucomicrobiales bacterium]